MGRSVAEGALDGKVAVVRKTMTDLRSAIFLPRIETLKRYCVAQSYVYRPLFVSLMLW